MTRRFNRPNQIGRFIWDKFSNRKVIFMKSRRPVSHYDGKEERLLVPVGSLNVSFGSFEGIRRDIEPKLVRQYWLTMFEAQGKFQFGGEAKKGCFGCKLLGRKFKGNKGEHDGRRSKPGCVITALRDIQVKDVSAEECAVLLPELVVKLSSKPEFDVDGDTMAALIRRLWLTDNIRKDVGEDGAEGLIIDLTSINPLAEETVILPEHVGRSGKFGYQLNLDSSAAMLESLGTELYAMLSKAIQKMHWARGLVPLELISVGNRRKCRHITYWDITEFRKASKAQYETTAAYDKDRPYEKSNHFGTLTVSYANHNALRFDNNVSVFDFDANFHKLVYDKELDENAAWYEHKRRDENAAWHEYRTREYESYRSKSGTVKSAQ